MIKWLKSPLCADNQRITAEQIIEENLKKGDTYDRFIEWNCMETIETIFILKLTEPSISDSSFHPFPILLNCVLINREFNHSLISMICNVTNGDKKIKVQ